MFNSTHIVYGLKNTKYNYSTGTLIPCTKKGRVGVELSTHRICIPKTCIASFKQDPQYLIYWADEQINGKCGFILEQLENRFVFIIENDDKPIFIERHFYINCMIHKKVL